MVLHDNSSQKCLVNAGVPQGSILTPTLLTLLDDVIWDIAMYADDTTLYSKCDQAFELWQQLELASELESDLQDTMGWCKKGLVDFNAEKTQLVFFCQSHNTGSTDVKMDWSVFEKNHLLRCLG